jgi:hypothetical protein
LHDLFDRHYLGNFDVFNLYLENTTAEAPRLGDFVLRRSNNQSFEWSIKIAHLAFLEKWLQLRMTIAYAPKCAVHCVKSFHHYFEDEPRRKLLQAVKDVMYAAYVPSRQGDIVITVGDIVIGVRDAVKQDKIVKLVHMVDEANAQEITFPLWRWAHASEYPRQGFPIQLSSRASISGSKEFRIPIEALPLIDRALETIPVVDVDRNPHERSEAEDREMASRETEAIS